MSSPLLPADRAVEVDHIRNRYEAALQAGHRPDIDRIGRGVPEANRPTLEAELRALELAYKDQVRIVLTVTEGPHVGRIFSFAAHDTFMVGRSKQAHFRLSGKDQYFSRFHFLVEMNPPSCRLFDLASRNGTYVNGQRVKTAELHDGDAIKAGHSILRFALFGGAAARPTTSQYQPAEQTIDYLEQSAPMPPAVASAAALPQNIPGYHLVRQIGKGGMGVVYEALRAKDSARVAVKTISPAVAGSKIDFDRFLREARILRDLQHQHIIAFEDMGEANGQLFFAMKYVAGPDARHLLQAGGPMSVERALALVCQLLDALDFAHERGYVHRDIKPSNFLVATEEGREVVKLADFGLARVYQCSNLSGLTLQGDVAGTLAFIAPEQILNFRDAKPAVDQYAAAATFYNLLTNHYIFDLPKDFQQQIRMILDDPVISIRTRRRDVPADLAALIHRALAKDPAKRFKDVRAFRRALVELGTC